MTESFEGEFGPLLDTTMRVATWNLWWRFGPWEARQPAIVDWLRRNDGAQFGKAVLSRWPIASTESKACVRIDYIFTGWPRHGGAGHEVRARLAGNEPVDGVWPSDHFAVVADLRYGDPSGFRGSNTTTAVPPGRRAA